MIGWFHHLFNPHCPECKAEREILEEQLKHRNDCPTCPIVTAELEKAQRLNEQLLGRLLEKPEKVEEVVKPTGNMTVGKPIMSWTARRQILEQESREAARKIEERQKELSVDDIEKELGVSQ